MPGVSKEQIAEAKQMDALTYVMAYEPNNIRKASRNEYRLIDHDSLKLSNGKWHWFSRGIGGIGALDFLIKVRGMGFVDAVELLTQDIRAGPVSYPQHVELPPKVTQEKGAVPFSLPKPNINNDRAVAYLLGRGIDKEILYHCIDAGILYESKRYHNCTFVGRDRKGKARFACVRSTTNNVRRDMDSSDKRYSFSLPAVRTPGNILMVAEAPIDALSMATLQKLETGTWNNRHYLSLGGTSPLALVRYLGDYREVDRLILGLDNDKAGRENAVKIMEAVFADETLRDRALTVTVEPPPHGNDYNDTLLAVIQEKKEYLKHSRPDRAAISM